MKEEEYDTENVTVQIVELSTDEIAKSNNWIGANKPIYEGEKSSENEESSAEEEDDDEEEEEEQIPGFTVSSTKPKKKPAIEKHQPDNDETEKPVEEVKRRKKYTKIPETIKSKRALVQVFAKRATNSLKNTKAFRLKDRLDQNRSKKKARAEKEKRTKLQNKREKHMKNSSKGQRKLAKANKMSKAPKGKKPKGKKPRK